MYFLLIQATQIEPALKYNIQMSFNPQVVFELVRLLKPKPPSFLGNAMSAHFSFAPFVENDVPCQKKALESEFTRFITCLDSIKAELQNSMI